MIQTAETGTSTGSSDGEARNTPRSLAPPPLPRFPCKARTAWLDSPPGACLCVSCFAVFGAWNGSPKWLVIIVSMSGRPAKIDPSRIRFTGDVWAVEQCSSSSPSYNRITIIIPSAPSSSSSSSSYHHHHHIIIIIISSSSSSSSSSYHHHHTITILSPYHHHIRIIVIVSISSASQRTTGRSTSTASTSATMPTRF
eukprot:COSAG05_NODE_1969_length_3768_cov_5.081221_2_plen_197_part_00